MLTLFIIAIVNGAIWFIFGYKLGKDLGQYHSASELMKKKEKKESLFRFTPAQPANKIIPQKEILQRKMA